MRSNVCIALTRVLSMLFLLMPVSSALATSGTDSGILIVLTELAGESPETYQVTGVLHQWLEVLFRDFPDITVERSNLCIGFNPTDYTLESTQAQREGILRKADLLYWGAYMVEGTRIRIALVTQYTTTGYEDPAEGSQPRIFTREEAFNLSEIAPSDEPPDLFAVNAYQNAAMACTHLGEYQKSLELLNMALELSDAAGDTEVAYLFLDRASLYYLAMNAPERALEDIETAIGLAPDVVQFRQLKDELIAIIENSESYEGGVTSDTDIEHGSLHYYYGLAVNMDLAGEYTQALEYYNAAIAAGGAPDVLAGVYTDRSLCYSYLGDYDAAHSDALSALELNPDHVMGYARLSEIAEDRGDHELCVGYLSTGISIEPDNLYMITNRARMHHRLGDLANARIDFQKAIELNPLDADLHYRLGSVFSQEGSLSDAAVCFTRAIDCAELPGEKAYYIASRGGCYLETGDMETAEADFNEALEYDSSCTRAFFFRGLMHYLLEEHNSAIRDMEKVLEFSERPNERSDAQYILDAIGN